MEIKSITLKGKKFNNVLLAPMAGYTDFSFRKAVSSFGYGLRCTELVSAKGLFFKGKGSLDLLKCDNYNDTVAQIFGSDPFYMRSACESEALRDFDIIDINMGCPVPKVFKNGEGSALLLDIKRAENVIKECVKSKKIITVKIRTGIKHGDDVASEYCKMAEDCGAKMVTIHGRVKEDYYSGEPDYSAIEKAKKSVKIPIIANGGIFTENDAQNMIDKTGVDGIMLARGAINDPFLVLKLLGKSQDVTLKEFVLLHIAILESEKGKERAAVEFRKFVPYYFKSIKGIKEVRNSLTTATNTDTLKEIIDKNF